MLNMGNIENFGSFGNVGNLGIASLGGNMNNIHNGHNAKQMNGLVSQNPGHSLQKMSEYSIFRSFKIYTF